MIVIIVWYHIMFITPCDI